MPEQAELDALLRRVSSGEIQMQAETTESVALGEGQAIDLGGIAKGYTSDLVEQTFRANGVESGKISLGGNVFVLGTKPDGSDWRVGIKDPQNEDCLLYTSLFIYKFKQGFFADFYDSDFIIVQFFLGIHILFTPKLIICLCSLSLIHI